jgi:hypothetical protein
MPQSDSDSKRTEAEMDKVFEKLERIQQLWRELERMKPNTVEYDQLIEKIRVLSAEYTAFIDVLKKSGKSK